MKTRKRFAAALLVTLLAAAAIASAEHDPPSRVVRLKYMSGEVSMQPGGVNDWVAAALNRPLTTADRVWTDNNARAELQLELVLEAGIQEDRLHRAQRVSP
jgi:hypothetical protein